MMMRLFLLFIVGFAPGLEAAGLVSRPGRGILQLPERKCYLGCITDAANDRALTLLLSTSASQGLDKCQEQAFAENLTYFGLQYGEECWGGNVMPGPKHKQCTRCKFACPGQRGEICGGWRAMSLFSQGPCNGTSPGPSPGPPFIPPPTYGPSYPPLYPPSYPPIYPFIPSPPKLPRTPVNKSTSKMEASCHLGCYTDDWDMRALPRRMEVSSDMTVEKCHEIAKDRNVALFGLQHGKECWGGEETSSAMMHGNSTDCTMMCPGNKTEICGGGLAIDLYNRSSCP